MNTNTMAADTSPARSGDPILEQLNDAARWNAVVGHDRDADGLFVYGVRSTGVYCRPSCPSRRPRRDRVAFFETPAAAGDAGFRPCLRCKPDRSMPVADPWVEKIRRACVYLSNVEGHPALSTLAARLGGSPYHLQRNFKRIVGVSPREYAEACRLGKVKRGLRQPGDITAAMFDAGYGSSSRFYERAVPKLGMPPAVYRRGGAGMRIQYTIVDSSNDALGRLLVAATPRGVCAVAMGASDADLTRALSREYPAATIAADSGALAGSANAIVAHLAGRRPRSSGRCGRRLRPFPTARPAPTARLPRPSAGRARSAPLRVPAPPIRSRSRFHVIECCRQREAPAATAGASRERKRS
jgi:AraC family transcriptional regulator of adaptative response/methylated-DNA-[protein]-cysteine methyltransferase